MRLRELLPPSGADTAAPRYRPRTASLMQLDDGRSALWTERGDTSFLREHAETKNARVERKRCTEVVHLEPHAPDARLARQSIPGGLDADGLDFTCHDISCDNTY